MTESASTPSPGDILAGKYEVERVLGVGGMGVVLAARHLELQERVAIKMMLPSALAVPDAIARFVREARAAARLKSQHVARVTDVGKLEDGSPYMVMEYLEGNDLGEVIQMRGALPVEEAIDYIVMACEALAEAHAAGIVHRDLKPANLFLAARPGGAEMIKVLDFGISKVLNPPGGTSDVRMTGTSVVVGSPLYMSPEQLKSSRDVDFRADIWAVGVTLFELLTGTVPYEAETMPLLCSKILTEPPRAIESLRPGIDLSLAAAVMRALEREPTARFQTIAEMAHALAPFGSPQSEHLAHRATMLLDAVPEIRAARLASSPALTPPMSMRRGSSPALSASSPTISEVGPAPSVGPPPMHARTATSFGTSQAGSSGVPKVAIVFGAIGLALLGGILAVLLIPRGAPPAADGAAHADSVTREPASSASAPASSVVAVPVDASASPVASPAPSTSGSPAAKPGTTSKTKPPSVAPPAAPPPAPAVAKPPATDDLYGARR